MININTIYNEDSFELMKKMKNDNIKVDFILTDVPYNVAGNRSQSPIGGSRKKWEDEKGLNFISDKGISKTSAINQSGNHKIIDGGDWKAVDEEWDIIDDNYSFTNEWLNLADDILTGNGTVAICCGDYVLGDVLTVLRELNYKTLNIIVWFKTNAPPNITCRTLTHSTEYIVWASKSGKNWTFNYGDMKAYTCEDDFLKKANKQMRNVWFVEGEDLIPQSSMLVIPNNKSKNEVEFGKHPTQKPERLFDRLIRMATNEGDLIFDPFAGGCTTAVCSKKLNRNYICCDLESEYIEIGNKRLENC